MEGEDNLPPAVSKLRNKKVQRSINLLANLQGLKKIINLVEDNNDNDEWDWSDEQILQLNPDKLMSDILDRCEALNVVLWAIRKAKKRSDSKDDDNEEDDENEESEVEDEGDEEEGKEEVKEGTSVDHIKCNIFYAACSMILSDLGRPRWKEKDDSKSLGSLTCSVGMLLCAFPDETKLVDGRDWLATHWAMLAAARPEFDVSEADVKALVMRDPMSMRKHHITGVSACQPGITPAQILCMQQKTDYVMALVRYYAIYNPRAFTMCASFPRDDSDETDCYSALHAACDAGCPSKELLQLLIQLDPSQATKMPSRICMTPLAALCHGALCFQQDRTEFNDAVQCLLAVDNSAEYIGDALCGLLYGACRSEGWAIEDATESQQQRVLSTMDMLLAKNADAAKYHSANGWNLLHHIASIHSTMPPQLCIVIMQRILALHADAVRERDNYSAFPVYVAANTWPTKVMEFLLDKYPEPATATFGQDPNILIYLLRRKNDAVVVVDLISKVRFLCSRYPQLVPQKDDEGYTALLWELRFEGFRLSVVKILCEAGGRELVSAANISPLPVAEGADQDDHDDAHGWLPLHMFIFCHHAQLSSCLPFSEAADCFFTLLHLYPEAAGIEAGRRDGKMTPYQIAVIKQVDPYYLRILLRAVPDLNPADLHRLNYADRRMAMFLAFSAVSTDDHLLLPRLRFANKDLLKRVVSFL